MWWHFRSLLKKGALIFYCSNGAVGCPIPDSLVQISTLTFFNGAVGRPFPDSVVQIPTLTFFNSAVGCPFLDSSTVSWTS